MKLYLASWSDCDAVDGVFEDGMELEDLASPSAVIVADLLPETIAALQRVALRESYFGDEDKVPEGEWVTEERSGDFDDFGSQEWRYMVKGPDGIPTTEVMLVVREAWVYEKGQSRRSE